MLMTHFIRCIALIALLSSTSVLAQLTDDPANIAQPVYPYQDPQRALVIRTQFNSATDVELLDVLVANTRARTAIGAPPQLLLELIDHTDQVIASRNDWHPLWESHWGDVDETEGGIEAETGEGTFYVPLSESLRKVRITDLELDQELITVDVSQAVVSYCQSNPTTRICVLFMDDFE